MEWIVTPVADTVSDHGRSQLGAYVQMRTEVAALRPEEREDAEVRGFALLEEMRLATKYPRGVSADDVAARVVVLAEKTYGPAFAMWIGRTSDRFARARARRTLSLPEFLPMARDEKTDEATLDLGDGRIARGHPEAIEAYAEARAAEYERNRRWPQRPDGSVDPRAALTKLARLFPTLRGASGIDPFDLETFVDWLCSGAPSGGGQRAGRFLLHVWNPRADYREFGRNRGLKNADDRLEPFNVSDALNGWDDEHVRAFIMWVEAPFWP